MLGKWECFVTEFATTPMTARPMEIPNWARVLKTAPANAWSPSGNTSETTRIPTVNSTRSCGEFSHGD